MKQPKHVLVTGGAGFIGSHTVKFLLEQEIAVTVLDNLSTGKLAHLDLAHPNLSFVEGDVLEFPLVKDLLADCDAVLHLAALASVPLSIQEPIYSFQVNTQGFLHILQAVCLLNHPIRIVYASSAAVYGNETIMPCRDDQPLQRKALSPYALQKIHCEDYADLYAHLYPIPSLGLRYFNVYGSGQDPTSTYSGVISLFLEAYAQQNPLTIFGNGHQSRDFIHVSDIARANWLALSSTFAGKLNIGTGKAENLIDLIQYIEAAGKRPAEKRFAPKRPGDIEASYASTKLAKVHLDFTAHVPLQEGIKQLMP